MSAFLDRQGKLVLALVVLLGLFYFIAYALNSKPKITPQEVVSAYLTALKAGDIKAAYQLLSDEDRQYFDIERFKMFLRRQPQLQFLYGGSEMNRAGLLRDYMSFVLVEPKADAKTSQPSNEVMMKVTLPDIAKVLEPDLLQYYLFGEENTSFTTEQSLMLSKRLESRLRGLKSAGTQSSYHRFEVVEHKSQVQLSVPEWRVEAMLYEAKQNLIKQETEEAARLLEEASSFVLQVDDLTRKTFVSEAIAGKHMLRYLPRIAISGFALTKQVGSCRYPVQLELGNYGERDVRSVEMVVQYMDEKGKEVIADQVIVLSKASLEAKKTTTTAFLSPEESVSVKACLTPPRDWSGVANTHIAWLTFTQAAN